MTKYYPILRHSSSEMNAYLALKEETKDAIVPIIESKRISTKNRDSWWTSFNTLGSYLYQKIKGRTFIYDFRQAYDHIGNYEEELLTDDDINIVNFCSSRLFENNLDFIPCLHHDSPDWLITTISNLKTKQVAIRIRCHTFDSTLDSIIFQRINNIIAEYFKHCDEVMIILDFLNNVKGFRRIEHAVETYSKLNLNSSLIISLTSCPANSDSTSSMSFSKATPRYDFNIYKKLVRTYPTLQYSDYTVRLAPEPEEGKNIDYYNTYLKIFYTTDDFYMIGKSTLLGNNGIENFIEICKEIVDSDVYSGQDFSQGDKGIFDCSKEVLEITNHGKPIELGINHHIEFTVHQSLQNSRVLRES